MKFIKALGICSLAFLGSIACGSSSDSTESASLGESAVSCQTVDDCNKNAGRSPAQCSSPDVPGWECVGHQCLGACVNAETRPPPPSGCPLNHPELLTQDCPDGRRPTWTCDEETNQKWEQMCSDGTTGCAASWLSRAGSPNIACADASTMPGWTCTSVGAKDDEWQATCVSRCANPPPRVDPASCPGGATPTWQCADTGAALGIACSGLYDWTNVCPGQILAACPSPPSASH